jgi:hypothetical protein
MKLFLYPNLRTHTQDTIPEYYDTTPFSEAGIKRHCEVVDSPDKADFLYMSQIVDLPEFLTIPPRFTHVLEFPEKHICDIEGDWPVNNVPDPILKCVKSGNATKKEHYVQPFCVRPCFSHLLTWIAKENPSVDLEFPSHVSFGFRGLVDPFGVRVRMARAIKRINVKNEVSLNQQWMAKQPIDGFDVNEYIRVIYENILSLCPRGSGMDTIRFYETCFFGRVPVVISEMAFMGDDDTDTSFIFKIPTDISEEEMAIELLKISQTPLTELIERGKCARNYFLNVVSKYFEDPTLYFINWMKKKNLLK